MGNASFFGGDFLIHVPQADIGRRSIDEMVCMSQAHNGKTLLGCAMCLWQSLANELWHCSAWTLGLPLALQR